MAAVPIIDAASRILSPILETVKKAVKDKDLAEQLEHDLTVTVMQHATRELEVQRDVLVSETGGTGLKAQWRPITMLVFVAIVANNYIIAPYIGLFFGAEYRLELAMPEQLWSLLQIGLGGYVVGRSAEKVAENLAKR